MTAPAQLALADADTARHAGILADIKAARREHPDCKFVHVSHHGTHMQFVLAVPPRWPLFPQLPDWQCIDLLPGQKPPGLAFDLSANPAAPA